jgi:hypothetical protein
MVDVPACVLVAAGGLARLTLLGLDVRLALASGLGRGVVGAGLIAGPHVALIGWAGRIARLFCDVLARVMSRVPVNGGLRARTDERRGQPEG